MKVENIQYKVYTDNANLLCSNSKNMHDSACFINTKFIRVVFSEKGKAGMRLEDRVYRVASWIRFYLKQANMAKR